ncbi:MAG: sulfatase-like hydrolase/transferase, partial [Planctomycetota bacterium]|nr:sulfatase-like hydrolase/transferase [Planctomycetota bacterium]
MLNSYFNRLVLISAGLGFGAFAYSAATMSGADLLRAFVVHFGGGLAVATPIALASVFVAKNATANSVFYAGLILGISPWLAALVPLPLALSCALALAIAAIMFGRGSQSANQVSLFAYASGGVFALLVVAGLWVGGAFGRQPLVNVLPERDDPIPTTPDVLLISVDTLRADIFVDPPAGLDFKTVQMMARRGISVPYALSSSSVTLPGHTTMLTGLDSLDHGVRDNFDPIPDGLPWLAKDFKKSGYHTAGVISNGLLSRDIGFGEGFEIYDDSEVPLRGDIRK